MNQNISLQSQQSIFELYLGSNIVQMSYEGYPAFSGQACNRNETEYRLIRTA